jgi:hypothetical protein
MTTLARLSRRSLVLGLGGLALAPAAFAAPLTFPLRVAYARIGPQGFVRLTSDDQEIWTGLQTRLGGLIDEIAPIQPRDMLGVRTPELDGGASCALVARQIAQTQGLSHVILYATDDGKRPEKSEHKWLTRAFATIRQPYYEYDDATAEAHLLGVEGGPAIASVSVDARKRNWYEVLEGRKPEREALVSVTEAMERRLQSIARVQYEAQRSIAD